MKPCPSVQPGGSKYCFATLAESLKLLCIG